MPSVRHFLELHVASTQTVTSTFAETFGAQLRSQPLPLFAQHPVYIFGKFTHPCHVPTHKGIASTFSRRRIM